MKSMDSYKTYQLIIYLFNYLFGAKDIGATTITISIVLQLVIVHASLFPIAFFLPRVFFFCLLLFCLSLYITIAF